MQVVRQIRHHQIYSLARQSQQLLVLTRAGPQDLQGASKGTHGCRNRFRDRSMDPDSVIFSLEEDG